ncbi:MAG: signal peptidase I [Vicinamibacteria bacterium]|nr:signal peptidase I [Vicinamibacteria bacterium]
MLGLVALQDEDAGEAVGAFGGLFGFLSLVFFLLMVVAMWKIFVKAGKPGWASIIPIYNLIVMLEISGKPIWWIILFFIPLVNFIVFILVTIAFAGSFGKGAGFGLGLVFLPFVFFPLLAFGDARYGG